VIVTAAAGRIAAAELVMPVTEPLMVALPGPGSEGPGAGAGAALGAAAMDSGMLGT